MPGQSSTVTSLPDTKGSEACWSLLTVEALIKDTPRLPRLTGSLPSVPETQLGRVVTVALLAGSNKVGVSLAITLS